MVILVLGGGVAAAAWRFVGGGDRSAVEEVREEGGSFQEELQETTAAQEGTTAEGEDAGTQEYSGAGAASPGVTSGEDFSYTSPEQRYVTETQRHQNFFRAVAEGRVRRLDVVSTDVRPVGDPDTSYVYFTLTTTDGGTSNGTMVMKYEGGMWRIAAIGQLQGSLGGGTNYKVPASFESDLAREVAELQPFLTKVAEGRLDYMAVFSASRPSENEAVLNGEVAGVGGRVVPAEMRLRCDYGIWHLTYVTNPP
ncbi:MAG: hypothetical protein H5T73_10580 [Actinobacteria bacterium]|nr:hypothetical protein [Actinomycetota bacterium]